MKALPLAIGVAAIVLALPVPVAAQDGIQVTAPRTVTAPQRRERGLTGAPIEDVAITARIRFSDLDLASGAGVATLNKRIRDFANGACKHLEIDYPVGTPEWMVCMKTAIEEAQPQVQAAIAAARPNGGSAPPP